jgi:surfeit locus 1 family protein
MRQKSLLGPTLFTLFGMILLPGLGTWQLQRLQWKEGLIAAREAGLAAAPVPLPATLAAARALEYRRVRASGRFLHDRTLYLYATAANGTPGYHVLTPLALAGGAVLMVDRGFVPQDRKDPATRAAANSSGEASVTGILRLPLAPGWFVPDNRPGRNEWFFIDLPAMAAAARVGTLLPFYIEADASPNPGGLPLGGQTPIDLPNNHLQYAITWYALAVALPVFYIALVRRRRRGDRT